MTSDKKLFSELSTIIQGEGIPIGTPSLMLRTSECNLRCKVCDSKFSWNEPPIYSIQEAVDFIRAHPLYSHIIISGGEPMLHQKEILELMCYFTHDEFLSKTFTIETNCTIKPTSSLKRIMSYYKGLWSVSPKTVDSSYSHCMDTIKYFKSLPNVQFKFVIDTPISDEIDKVLSLKIKKQPIVLQPNGMVPDYNNACRLLAEYVISNSLTNLRVLPQFHKICWGNKRGV